MRIIFYAYEIYPLGGGVGNAVKNIFEQFQNYKNLKIDFVTTSLSGKLEVYDGYKNITFHRLPIGKRKIEDYSIQKPIHMVLYTILSYFYTWRLVLKNKYDLTHSFGYPGGVASMLFSWLIPYVVSIRGIDVPGYNKKYGFFYLLYKPLCIMTWHFAKKVISNSKALADLAKESYRNLKIDIIPNGIDSELFSIVKESKKFSKFTITAGGTLLGVRKGLKYLLQGFAKFAKDKGDVELILYGDGEERENLRNLAIDLKVNKKVKFRGKVDHEIIANELPLCHIFCLPSLNEGMSNAVLEALSSGLPLLLTDTGGTHELLDNNVNGYIINKNSFEEINKYLEILYKDSELRKKMGKLSRKKAELMSWEVITKEYYDLYLSVINCN